VGHALAIAAALAVAAALGRVVPIRVLETLAAAALIGFGIFHLTGHRHPLRGGMRVGAGELTIWSFVMASAHGAGLMLLPLVLKTPPPPTAVVHGPLMPSGHVMAAGPPPVPSIGVVTTLAHTAGYLLVAGLLAAIVYEKLGLRLLRTAWINIDAIWAAALLLTGVLTVLL